MTSYLVQFNERDLDYSILRVDGPGPWSPPVTGLSSHVVQTGLRTLAKAEAARQGWEQREAGKDVQQYRR
jgi:hypothetical protein